MIFEKLLQEKEWQADADWANCPDCNASFGALCRRSHCRCCGGVYCGKCITEVSASIRVVGLRQLKTKACNNCIVAGKHAFEQHRAGGGDRPTDVEGSSNDQLAPCDSFALPHQQEASRGAPAPSHSTSQQPLPEKAAPAPVTTKAAALVPTQQQEPEPQSHAQQQPHATPSGMQPPEAPQPKKLDAKHIFEKLLQEKEWQTDTDWTNCPGCNASFGALCRRSHCRPCGGVYCGKCITEVTAAIRSDGLRTSSVKACPACVRSGKDAYEHYANTGSGGSFSFVHDSFSSEPILLKSTSMKVDFCPDCGRVTNVCSCHGPPPSASPPVGDKPTGNESKEEDDEIPSDFDVDDEPGEGPSSAPGEAHQQQGLGSAEPAKQPPALAPAPAPAPAPATPAPAAATPAPAAATPAPAAVSAPVESKSGSSAATTNAPVQVASPSSAQVRHGAFASVAAQLKRSIEESESVLFAAKSTKTRYLRTQSRLLILTDLPRLIYVDEETMKVKGSLYIRTRDFSVEHVSSASIRVKFKGKDYPFDVEEGTAEDWVTRIKRQMT